MTLLEKYTQHLEQLSARKVVLTKYFCPVCAVELQTLSPKDNQVWDSMATCPYCLSLYFTIITKGKVNAIGLNEKGVPDV